MELSRILQGTAHLPHPQVQNQKVNENSRATDSFWCTFMSYFTNTETTTRGKNLTARCPTIAMASAAPSWAGLSPWLAQFQELLIVIRIFAGIKIIAVCSARVGKQATKTVSKEML